jgi:hypothetical protein
MALVLKKPNGVGGAAPAAAKGTGFSFLKRGPEAQETFAKEEFKAEQNMKKKTYRYFVTKGETSALTFLDGNLNSDGLLDIPYFYEHNVQMNGKYGNYFVCTTDAEPCPICEGGLQHSYVGLLTVIDHSQYTSKKDGKVYKDTVKIFAAKRDTIKQLLIYATKRGGLRGCRFDVSRTGDKSPSVGNMFDFTSKATEGELKASWGVNSEPVNYDEYISSLYLPAKDLRKMGFGSSAAPIGSEQPLTNSSDYDATL